MTINELQEGAWNIHLTKTKVEWNEVLKSIAQVSIALGINNSIYYLMRTRLKISTKRIENDLLVQIFQWRSLQKSHFLWNEVLIYLIREMFSCHVMLWAEPMTFWSSQKGLSQFFFQHLMVWITKGGNAKLEFGAAATYHPRVGGGEEGR